MHFNIKEDDLAKIVYFIHINGIKMVGCVPLAFSSSEQRLINSATSSGSTDVLANASSQCGFEANWSVRLARLAFFFDFFPWPSLPLILEKRLGIVVLLRP